MKQGYRLIAKPATFFNQLQWSTHHWVIMVAFLGLAFFESQVGRSQAFFQESAVALQGILGVTLDQAVWLVTFIRLSSLLIGSFAMTVGIWFVGTLFGRRTSKRVLFRRLAVVFTVALAGFTAQNFSAQSPVLMWAGFVLYGWSVLLGYYALREQFGLGHLETVVVGMFALLLVTSSWHFSNHVVEAAVKSSVQFAAKQVSETSLAAKPSAAPGPKF